MSNINAQTIIAEVMAAHAIAPSRQDASKNCQFYKLIRDCLGLGYAENSEASRYMLDIEYQESFSEWMHCGEETPRFVTFKTSARGSHRVLNCKENLQRFADLVRKNAAAFGGGLVREAKTSPAVSYASKTISLYKQLIEDRDYFAALQLAEEKLSPLFFFGNDGKSHMQVAPIPLDSEPRLVSLLGEDGKWSVCCPVSMLGLDSLTGNKRSRQAQIDAADQHLRVMKPEKKEAMMANAHARPVDQSAARAQWMADHGIVDDEAIAARIEQQAAQDVAEIVAQAVAVSAIAEAMAPAAETESTPELVTCEAGESESNCASIAQFINVAADSVGTLRKIDVSRVMDEAPTQYRQELAAYIQYNRPDLAQEVSDVLEEITPTTTPAVISGTVTSPVAISKEYRYAMVNRPFSIGTAPTDGIIRMDARPSQGDPHHDMARHGIAVYNRQLTDKETMDYELAPIADDAMMENLCAAVTHDIAEYATEYVSMASDDWVNFEAHVINTMKRVTTSFRVSIESNRAFADMVLTALTTATRAPSTPAAETVEPQSPRPVESTEDAPRIIQQRPSDWPYASSGWSTVGGGRNAPGYASERSAKIDLSKNPEWKERDARIVAFKWNDGGICGCSPYWKTETRYAILVKKMPEVAEVAPIEDTSPVVESAEITAPAPEPVPVVEIEATTPAAEIQIEPVAHVVGTESPQAAKEPTPTPDDTQKFRVRAKSGEWRASFMMIGTMYALLFNGDGSEITTTTYATHAERMQALEAMARATTPPDTPPDGGLPIEPVDAPTEAPTPPVAECTPGAPVAVSTASDAPLHPRNIVPTNGVHIVDDAFEAWTYQSGARFGFVMYLGKSAKPWKYYGYKSEAARDDGFQRHAAEARDIAAFKAKRKAEDKAKAEQGHGMQVGDVVRSSWGYDQTNVNHYQITKLIGKRTVEVRELVEHKESTGDMSGRVAPVWGEFVGEPMRRTVDKYGHVNILREKFGRASKIEPVAIVHGVRCYASTGYSNYA